MILTCPSCATSYFTPDDAIGPTGRRVRCQSCAHVWHATIEEPLELTSAASPTDIGKAGFGKRDDAQEALIETPAPELPRAFRARAEQQRRLRRAATHGAVWAGLASVFVGLIAAAWLFRVEVVETLPGAARAYAAVGAPVNPTGLEFEAMAIKVAPHDPGKVLISGAIRNIRDREVVAPPVRVALLDAYGAEIGHRIVPLDAAPVLPGGVQGFAAMVADPGAKIVGIGVDFAPETDRVIDVETARAPTPPRRPPPADPDPLRSALAPIVSAQATGPPIEAVPLAPYPVDALPLDIDPAEAVSASHG